MTDYENFVGSIRVGSGFKAKGDFPLLKASDVAMGDGTRLDTKLNNLKKELVDEVLNSLPIAEEVSV